MPLIIFLLQLYCILEILQAFSCMKIGILHENLQRFGHIYMSFLSFNKDDRKQLMMKLTKETFLYILQVFCILKNDSYIIIRTQNSKYFHIIYHKGVLGVISLLLKVARSVKKLKILSRTKNINNSNNNNNNNNKSLIYLSSCLNVSCFRKYSFSLSSVSPNRILSLIDDAAFCQS